MGRVLFWQIAGIVLFWAVLVALRLDQPIDVTNPEVRLGDHTYVKSDLNAPILSGALLSVFEYVATRSVFGGAIRRFLLNDNKIRHLRELGAQMPADVLPLSHPLRRLNKAEREEYDVGVQQAVAKHTDLDSIVPFVVSDTVRQSLALQNSEVLRLHDAFLAGTTTPTAVTGKVLSEIDRLQPVYKMFASAPLSDEILAAAAASTQRYASGAPLSIFDGVPVAFKDMINIAGYVMTDGSAFKRKFNPVSNKDDLIVKRFRDIGAIIMPPTSMVEGGVSPVGFCVEVQGPFNPHKASHYSGGSSGGSAVAVALGIVPVAIGYDGGGSIRTPASLSGVVGFATGYGRLPFESHITGTNIKGGPFTRTVADAALAYAVMARPVPEGVFLLCACFVALQLTVFLGFVWTGYRGFFDEMYDGNFNGVPKAILNQFLQPAPKGPGGETRDLVGVKLGVMREWFDDCDSSVREVAWAGFAQLVARGATVVDVVGGLGFVAFLVPMRCHLIFTRRCPWCRSPSPI